MYGKISISYGSPTFTSDYLRATITGEIIHGICLSCNGSGEENWNEDGEDIKPGHSYADDRSNGPCENCEGLGFIVKQDNRK